MLLLRYTSTVITYLVHCLSNSASNDESFNDLRYSMYHQKKKNPDGTLRNYHAHLVVFSTIFSVHTFNVFIGYTHPSRIKHCLGTLMQIRKSAIIFIFIWKYIEDFILKHLFLFKICAREICEKFVYKHSETIEYFKNEPTF